MMWKKIGLLELSNLEADSMVQLGTPGSIDFLSRSKRMRRGGLVRDGNCRTKPYSEAWAKQPR
jgi:hypothetical protein